MNERKNETIITVPDIKLLGSNILQKIQGEHYSLLLDVWRGGTAVHIFLSHLEEYQDLLAQNMPIWHCRPMQVKHGAEYTVPGGIIDEDNILIIDDLLDSCDTMKNIYQHIRRQSKRCRINIMCLFVKQLNKAMLFLADSKVKLIYAEDVSADRWIKFPWEAGGENTRNNDPKVTLEGLHERLKGTSFDPDELQQQKLKLIEHKEGDRDGKNLEKKRQYWQQKINEKWKRRK
jgi:hypoxanthine phosphoribosyltransferase